MVKEGKLSRRPSIPSDGIGGLFLYGLMPVTPNLTLPSYKEGRTTFFRGIL